MTQSCEEYTQGSCCNPEELWQAGEMVYYVINAYLKSVYTLFLLISFKNWFFFFQEYLWIFWENSENKNSENTLRKKIHKEMVT